MDQELKAILAQTIDGFIKSVIALRREINVYFFKHMAAETLPTIVAAGEDKAAERIVEMLKERVLQGKNAQQEFSHNLKLLKELKDSLEGKASEEIQQGLVGNDVEVDDFDQWMEEIKTIMEEVAKKVRKQHRELH